MLFKEISGKVIILTMFFFALLAFEEIRIVANNEETCICSYDGFGYYMYTPHLFSEGNLNMTPEWAQGIQDTYCDSITAYQLVQRPNGNYQNVYHIGMAYLQLPAYFISDLFARSAGFPTNGFSKPYHIGYIINAFLFIFLGLVYLRKLLRLFFNDKLSALLILMAFAGTNIYITYTQQFDLPHLYLFALNAIFLYFLFRFTKSETRKHLLLSALFFGLTVSIRPTQALLGIIPFIVLFKEYRNTKLFWSKILIYPLFSIVWNIPQMFYWYFVGGKLIVFNLHVEEIILTDPNLIDFLFSYRKGWLLYTPLFLLLILGFIHLFRKNRNLFWAFGIGVFLYIYIMSSWECWWYASSFGSRVMVDIYPLLIVILGFAVLTLKSLWSKIAVGIFIIGCVLLNYVQSLQFERAYLHSSRMSKQHYWYIFGKTTIPDYTETNLLIDRSSLTWPKYERSAENYSIDTKEVFSLKAPLQAQPGEDLTIGRLNLYELLETDETLFSVRIKFKTSDPTQSSILRLETVSIYNCYSWDNMEVSIGSKKGEYIEQNLLFNLPDIRHNADQMQIYLDNDNNVTVDIEEMTITAYSLIRK